MQSYHDELILQFDDDATGNAASGELVTVFNAGLLTKPSIFDIAGAPIANPLTTDLKGNYSFQVADGVYDVVGRAGTGDETRRDGVKIFSTDLINDLSQAYIFATVAEFKDSLIEFPDGKTIRLLDRGADFTKITGTGTANTFNIIASTSVNQSIELDVSGGFFANQWGLGLGAADDTVGFQLLVISNRKVHFPSSTYNLDNVSFKGLKGVELTGDGSENSIFNFSLVASGVALDLGFDGISGGTQKVTMKDIGFTDTRATSLVDTMLLLESGLTGQSPAQTSAFFTFINCGILKYNNINGIGRHIKNVSHVTMDDWADPFENGMGESLVLETSININTGVWDFNNNYTVAKKRPVRITANTQLMDTINFNGGFIGNWINSDARECMLLEGDAPIAALNIRGTHWENRDDTEVSVIKVNANWASGEVSGNHFSCGTDAKKTQTLVNVTGDANTKMEAVTFSANEQLRLKEKADGGRVFFFDAFADTEIERQVHLGNWFYNTTQPELVVIGTGANEIKIYKSIVSQPTISDRVATGTDRMYELQQFATPDVQGADKFEITSAWAGGNITDFVNEYKGQLITIYNESGGNITIENDFFKIRCKGAANLVLPSASTVQFLRSQSGNHWVQTGEVVTT